MLTYYQYILIASLFVYFKKEKMVMRVKSWRNRFFIILSLVAIASTAYAAYHHAGDTDSQDFQVVYPEKTGTKLFTL